MLPPIYPILTANAAVAAIAGDRIYPHADAPQETPAPYVTWFVAAGAPQNSLSDPPPVDRLTVQVDCWHETSAGVVELASAVRSAIEPNAHIAAYLGNTRDPETRLYRIGLQADWWVSR